MVDFDKVPSDWTKEQRAFFARTYKFLMANQEIVKHPDAETASDQHWSTFCWNAAFAAVENLEDINLVIVDADDGEELGRTPRAH